MLLVELSLIVVFVGASIVLAGACFHQFAGSNEEEGPDRAACYSADLHEP